MTFNSKMIVWLHHGTSKNTKSSTNGVRKKTKEASCRRHKIKDSVNQRFPLRKSVIGGKSSWQKFKTFFKKLSSLLIFTFQNRASTSAPPHPVSCCLFFLASLHLPSLCGQVCVPFYKPKVPFLHPIQFGQIIMLLKIRGQLYI